jgi:hypothetical protein
MSDPRPAAVKVPLSRRIIARTADILAMALVLIICLTMGREVLRWWQTEPPRISAAPKAVPAWGENGQPVELEFGELPFTMTRQTFSGDRTAVRKLLHERCRAAVLSESRLPTVPDDQERSLLEKLAALKPLEEKAGAWKVIRVLDPFELTVSLRKSGDEWRVLAWGTAMPMDADQWAVHLFAAGPSASKIAGLPPVPVPPGSRKLVSLREARGGSLTGFLGTGPVQAWTQYYDNWFSSHGWKTTGWSGAGDHRTARFRSDTGPGTADIQMVREGDAWRGIVSVLEE